MTVLQKIQNLTWWTLDIKLKDILTSLFTTTENIDTRVTDIENSGVGISDHTQLTNIGVNTHAQVDTHISSTNNPHSVTKTQVGLSNVDNTSDLNKPLSTAEIDALALKLNAGGYVGTAEDLRLLIINATTGVTGTSVTPSSTPTGTGVASWVALQAGTYTNFGGVVVNANSIAVISRSATNFFSITQTALNIRIATWTTTSYASGDQVIHLGKFWKSNAATISTDVPGTSSKWTEVLSAYLGKAEIATVGGKNIFSKDLFREGFYRTDTGVFQARANSKCSTLIPVSAATAYYLSGRNGTDGFAKLNIVFFNSSSVVISMLNTFLNGAFTTPANTAFVGFNIYADNLGTDTAVQLELGQVPTTYEAYQVVKTIETFNNEPVFYERSKIVGEEIYSYPSRLNGKKVAWFGTSIPHGGGRWDGGAAILAESYPTIACEKLGATIYNESQSSSLIRIANTNGTPVGAQFTNGIFGRTIAEATTAGTGVSQSYETKLFNRLDADVFVFNFDYNDYATDSTNFGVMPVDPFNRNTFIGSHNYVIARLLEKKPKARIIIFGFYENQSTRGQQVQLAHQAIADYWGIPFFKTFEKTGWSQKLITKEGDSVAKIELVQWMPDGIHPASDPTGEATALLSRLAEICLETCF
jgi:hypothetical protein